MHQIKLVIANFSDFDLELLLLVPDVLDGDVDDRQPRRLRVLQAEDGQCPFLVLMLKNRVQVRHLKPTFARLIL